MVDQGGHYGGPEWTPCWILLSDVDPMDPTDGRGTYVTFYPVMKIYIGSHINLFFISKNGYIFWPKSVKMQLITHLISATV